MCVSEGFLSVVGGSSCKRLLFFAFVRQKYAWRRTICCKMRKINVRRVVVLADVLGGYNGTIFAYGQTSSGKTHTMEVSKYYFCQEVAK